MRILAGLILAALALPAAAQAIEPGEWEFTSTLSSPTRPTQTFILKQCVKPEGARDPARWIGQGTQNGECKVTHNKGGAGTWTYYMECPARKLKATGKVRQTEDQVEGDVVFTGEKEGQRFEMRSHLSGRRLGACKS